MFGYYETSLLNINRSDFTNVISYGKKVVGTTAGYFGATVGYLSSAASYLTPQSAKDLFVGKSSDHFANVATHTKEAAVATAELSVDTLQTTGHAVVTAVQAGIAHATYHGVTSNLEDAKIMLNAAAYVAKRVSPGSLPTQVLEQVSNITNVLDGFVDKYPLLSHAAVVGGLLVGPALSGDTPPALKAIKGAANMTVDAAKIAKHLGCAGAEAVAGTILYAKETMEGSLHSEPPLGAQTGFGDSMPHHTSVEPFGMDEGFIYACGEVFSVTDTI